MSDTKAAGWHEDPTGRHELRYWDGSQWTDHVSDGGTTGTDPVAGGRSPAAASTGGATGPARSASSPVITAPLFWIVVAVAVVGAFVGGALIAGGGDDAAPQIPDDLGDLESIEGFDDGIGEELDGGAVAPDDGDAGGADTAASEADDLTVFDQGFLVFDDEFDSTQVTFAAIVENPNPDTHLAQGVSVEFVFRDSGGGVLDTESAFISSILPGQRAAASGSVSASELSDAASLDIQVDVGFWDETDLEGSFETQGVTTSEGDFGLRTTGDITSNFGEDLEFVEVGAIYRDAGGDIVGGGFTSVDRLPAGDTRAFEIETFTLIPGATATEIFATANVF